MINLRIFNTNQEDNLMQLLSTKPFAKAVMRGSKAFPGIKGKVLFCKYKQQVVVAAFIDGLPVSEQLCSPNIFAFHIHEGEKCEGDEFESAEGHFNPQGCPHPAHAGDMPPLFATKQGKAVLVFLSDRFSPQEIIGKTVIIHDKPDDFTTQPSGNSGTKIACGVITKV